MCSCRSPRLPVTCSRPLGHCQAGSAVQANERERARHHSSHPRMPRPWHRQLYDCRTRCCCFDTHSMGAYGLCHVMHCMLHMACKLHTMTAAVCRLWHVCCLVRLQHQHIHSGTLCGCTDSTCRQKKTRIQVFCQAVNNVKPAVLGSTLCSVM